MANKKTKGQTTIYKIVYRKQNETHCSGSMNLQDFFKITISNKDTQSQKITLDKRFKIHWKQIIMYIQQSISKADTFGTYIFMRNKYVFELHRFD
jgi:hypothetical protein